MSGSDDVGQLETKQWDQLQALASRFEAAWKSGESVDLARYLPPVGDPLRPAALTELIKSDLEARVRRGQPIGLESYLDKFPELGQIDDLPASLIYEEFRIRQFYGDRPLLAGYRARFPDQFVQLERLVQEQPIPTIRATQDPQVTPQATLVSAAPVIPTASAQSSSQRTLQVGGGYQLIKRIGSGSFAEVFLAKAPGGIDVAVKCIIQPVGKAEADQELRSLEDTKKLRHPYLLQTQAFWLLDDKIYIVMELADGSLRDRLKKCREAGLNAVPLSELLIYFKESAEAIDFLHTNPVKKLVHRDIKPENILLLQGHAKVADFGLARALQTQRMSVSGGAGTPRYMAPEVWDSKMGKVGPASDLYSLAMSYAELRMGRSAFAVNDMMGLMLAALKEAPDLHTLPEPEQKVLLKALAKNPTERYGSCKEWMRELEVAVSQELRQTNPDLFPAPDHPNEPQTIDLDMHGTLTPTDRSGPDGVPIWKRVAKGSRYDTEVIPPPARSLLPMLLGSLVGAALLAVAALVAWKLLTPGPVPTFAIAVDKELVAKAGATTKFIVTIQRNGIEGPAQFSFPEHPPGVEPSAPGSPTDSGTVMVQLTIAPDAVSGPIKIQAVVGDRTEEATVQLSVSQPAYYLPPGWRRTMDAKLVHFEGDDRYFYDHIEVDKDGLSVPFVLIARDAEPEHGVLEPFYIMKDKVSIGLYRAYADKEYEADLVKAVAGGPRFSPRLLKPDWRALNRVGVEGPVRADEYPVMGIPAPDAHQFAEWLIGKGHGFLPRAKQWEKASGCYEPNAGQGPFQGIWPKDKPIEAWGTMMGGLGWTTLETYIPRPRVAVRRDGLGPMKCGEATDDINTFGLRDMAGNGDELTRDCKYDTNNYLVPVAVNPEDPGLLGRIDVILRGRAYHYEQPFLYSDMLNKLANDSGVQSYLGKEGGSAIGFRVVIQIQP